MATIAEEGIQSHRTFYRFLLVGLVNTAVGLTTTIVLLNILNLSFWYATFIGNSVGTIISYLLNRSYTFGSKAAHARSMIRFVVVVGCSYFIAYYCGKNLALYVCANWTVMPNSYVDHVAVVLGSGLYTIINYWGQRYLVFPTV